MLPPQRQLVVYVLHSSNLYGTERMALTTAQMLADEYETIFIGPRGPALREFERLGFKAHQYRTTLDLAKVLWPIFRDHQELAVVSTGPRYSLTAAALNLYWGRRLRQIEIIHGGAGEREDYARKKFLNPLDLTFVTVSEWSKQKLVKYGVPAGRIEVVGNFLTGERASAPQRPPYTHPGYRKVLLVSRVDPLKRIDVLLDALDRVGDKLRDVQFRIVGVGILSQELSERARRTHPNVEFAGYTDDVAGEIARADLLVHTCPVESFGLAVLEAMAARLAVLAPDSGGCATLIREGETGFSFRANDPDHLAARLLELKEAPAERFNFVAASALREARTRHSPEASVAKYRQLFSTHRANGH